MSRIGNGRNTNFWFDNWITWNGKPQNLYDLIKPGIVDEKLTVVDFLDENTNAWDMGKVREVVQGLVVSVIEEAEVRNSECEDKVVRWGEKNGKFSVKSAYRLALPEIAGDTLNQHRITGDFMCVWCNIQCEKRIGVLVGGWNN
ncbi:hypothetical protein FRX31_006383 [Thalictrum thalictroides]|uniref:Uncharacterized protein n=1 Tax=Thalictrum thalictroides TaxID=46969 RepID=A0A7J6X2N9_THATH|nr:hypothetical protein FRX31_006383 [Thalictrum thalictroides]